MMAEEIGTSRDKKSCDSLMTIRLDVSRGPLDLRPWPASQVVAVKIAVRGRTLPGRKTRVRIARVDVGPFGAIRAEQRPGDDPLRDSYRPWGCVSQIGIRSNSGKSNGDVRKVRFNVLSAHPPLNISELPGALSRPFAIKSRRPWAFPGAAGSSSAVGLAPC
jgi:hypothetical protein